VRNLRTMKVVYWVNVSVSSGASSPGLSQKKDAIKQLLCLHTISKVN